MQAKILFYLLLGTILQLTICASLQVLLALPFLLSNPYNYLKGAFDLGRVFLFKWTVNWRFLPEETFLHPGFHVALLAAHVLVLLVCLPRWWKMLSSYAKLRRHDAGPSNSIQLLLLPLFMSNFIGMVFARSLHYQFYVWYFHQLHYLLWCTGLPAKVKILILGLIEICWNTYPSTDWSSGTLQACHLVMLVSLMMYTRAVTEFKSELGVKTDKNK
jgi:alpha-1,3-mannosyltransferase